jgi:cytidyltransferase-like protein
MAPPPPCQVFTDLSDLPPRSRGAVVAIGNFDGVHRGHLFLIEQARRRAHALGTTIAALTFAPHPRCLFRPDRCAVLTSDQEKQRLLCGAGLDALFVQKFDRAFAGLTAVKFVDLLIVKCLGARHLVVGEDFCFGTGKQGGVELLLELGSARGFGVTSIAPLCDPSGRTYSSTRALAAVAAGDMALAAEILGRPWRVEGIWRPEGIFLAPLVSPKSGTYAAVVESSASGTAREQAVTVAEGRLFLAAAPDAGELVHIDFVARRAG